MAPHPESVAATRRRGLGLGLVVVLALAAVLAGCGATAPGVRNVAAADAVREIGSRVVIDVRTPAEVADGIVDGALNIDFQAPGFRERISELDRGGAYLLYCRTGNRSAQAAAIMDELGFTDVIDGGGFAALVAAGAPTAP